MRRSRPWALGHRLDGDHGEIALDDDLEESVEVAARVLQPQRRGVEREHDGVEVDLLERPHAQGIVGGTVDLREVPGKDAFVDRFGYLLDFDEPWYSLTNPGLGLTATVRWDGERFPYAWFWCEAQGSAGFPWHQRAYVLAVEPATSHPGSGLAVARDETKTAIWFEPDEELTGHVVLEVGPS